MVLTKLYSTCLYSGPTGVTRRQFLVNVLLDVMVQDTGFTVRVLVSKKNPFVYCNFYPSATRYQKSHGGQMIGIMHWNLVVFDPWPGTLCCVLGQGTYSASLQPVYRVGMGTEESNSGGAL